MHKPKSLREFLWHYGFSILCLVAPLFFAVFTVTAAFDRLIPEKLEFKGPGQNSYRFDYRPAVPKAAVGATAAKPVDSTTSRPPDVPDSKPADATSPKPATGSATAAATPDPKIFLPARQYYAQAVYAVVSGFLYLFAGAAFCFAVWIVFHRCGAVAVFVSLAFFSVVALAVTDRIGIPRGRYLVVDDLLNQADNFPVLKELVQRNTGDSLRALVRINTIVGLIPVGMIMAATAALSMRATGHQLDYKHLKYRLINLRRMILLSSALLVMGVVANRAMVDWPLSLVSDDQALALRPMADALILEFGASGTIASLALFAPAIAAWTFDVERFHDQRRQAHAAPTRDAHGTNDASEAEVAGRVVTATWNRDTEELRDEQWLTRIPRNPEAHDARDAAPAEAADGLVIAPTSTITAIVAVLAPILASPFIDGLKAIIGRF